MSILRIPTAKVFEPLLSPARYKGLYGGRGSGKSHFFGELMVETNYEIFEEVLEKILMNAWESYDNKPTDPRPLSVHTRLVEKPDEGKIVEIRIVDHGRGLDPEIRDKMFEPFVSTKNTVGVGMGLTVARHALRNLGGEVMMSDTTGGGATATLMHPVEKRLRKNQND